MTPQKYGGLRVYAGPADLRLVQVSSRAHEEIGLFLPMFLASHPMLAPIDQNLLVQIRYRSERWQVPFLLAQSIREPNAKLRLEGNLEQEDSFNLLNHLIDNLDWP